MPPPAHAKAKIPRRPRREMEIIAQEHDNGAAKLTVRVHTPPNPPSEHVIRIGLARLESNREQDIHREIDTELEKLARKLAVQERLPKLIGHRHNYG